MAAELAAFDGAVLAGGASTRMGRDKALIEIDGVAMVTIAVEALRTAGAADVWVVGGDREAIETLGHRWVPDLHPGEGPLGGVITALTEATADVVAVLACDHVAAAAPAVRIVVGALGDGDVAVPVVEGRSQTLHAAWRRSVLQRLEDVFDNGGRSVRDGLAVLDVVQILDGDPCWFADADTPADLP